MDCHKINPKIESLNLFRNLFELKKHSLGPFLAVKNSGTEHLACQLIAHDWSEKCIDSASLLFIGSFKKSLRVYASLYLVSALLRGKSIQYLLTKLPFEAIRSSLFLGMNCFNFLLFFCLSRKFFGGISYWGSLLFNLPACFLSIIIERKQRRGLLALYLTNLAVETGFNMLVSRGKLTRVPNGEVLLFALATSAYSLLFKMKALDGSFSNLIKILVGASELPDTKKIDRKSRVVKYYGLMTVILNNAITQFNEMFLQHHNRHNRWHNALIDGFRNFEHRIERKLDSLSKCNKYRHEKCHHRYNCLIYSILGFLQRFLAGYGLQAVIKLFGSIGIILKKPNVILKILKNKENFQLGMFLGSFVFIFRGLSCLLRWLTNSHDKLHGLIAGFFAGWSMIFYKSSSIALYLNFKLFEILWMLGVKNNKLPLIRSFDSILYTISTAFVLWVALYEPHNIRKAYWRFLVKISDNKFAQVNRHILDVFGLKSSSIDK
ncbi:unnamed protein product [Brachionus calyciflorus]|uniref:Transmembrane protein 135 N-terminal domain-containing protein n=1 Tax=Brachionus calyciflorus TaxID=104777 RepID=A0A813N5N6_9BILA|nr:unnamed protein product [Brachionus calyciflorus]